MTKEQIKKALRCTVDDTFGCGQCAYGCVADCAKQVRVDALALIEAQEDVIEWLRTCNDKLSQGIYFGNGEQFCDKIKQAKIEVLERLKNSLENCSGCYIPNEFESPTNEFAYSEKEVNKMIDELIEEVEE